MASTDLDPLGFPEVFDTVLDVNDLPNTWAALLEVLAKRVVITFNSTTERDAALAGLGPSDVAYAYVEAQKALWRWNGTTWAPATVWRQQGTVTFGAVPAMSGGVAGGISDIFITFPVPFTSGGYIPTLVTSLQAPQVSISVVARTATQLQLRVQNFTSVASSAGATLYWSATITP